MKIPLISTKNKCTLCNFIALLHYKIFYYGPSLFISGKGFIFVLFSNNERILFVGTKENKQIYSIPDK